VSCANTCLLMRWPIKQYMLNNAPLVNHVDIWAEHIHPQGNNQVVQERSTSWEDIVNSFLREYFIEIKTITFTSSQYSHLGSLEYQFYSQCRRYMLRCLCQTTQNRRWYREIPTRNNKIRLTLWRSYQLWSFTSIRNTACSTWTSYKVEEKCSW